MYSAFVNMWIRKIHTRGLAFASLNNRYLLESYSLKFCYARHASFYSILYLILSTTELLYSKSLSNTTLHCKYSKSLSNTTSSNAVLDTTRFLKSSVLTLSNADFTVFCNISWATLMIPCTTLIFST